MTRVPEPHNGRIRKTGHTVRDYRGTCPVCRYGIFGDEPAVRGRGQWLGILHEGCAREVGQA